ncbi:hypothetical protein RU61_02154 [Salmonella enterica subsp. enterica serovar Derby]|nr:hypothetical protein SEED0626_08236 [Salmonella enterica subsp. enterica serovar Derby str. 626]KMM42145.1 hypothetical protein RU61_02154 [Salmonella enterica subsp. enterica serovar Derby]
MLDSLPDAALPFRAYKSRCLKIGRRRRGQLFTASAQGPERTKCT